MKVSVTSLHQCIIATYQIIAWHHITSHHITFFTACTTIYVYLCSSLNVLHLHGTHRVHLTLPFIPHSFQTCCRQRLTWWQRPIQKSHAQIPWPRISSAPKLLQLLMPLCPMLTWTRHANWWMRLVWMLLMPSPLCMRNRASPGVENQGRVANSRRWRRQLVARKGKEGKQGNEGYQKGEEVRQDKGQEEHTCVGWQGPPGITWGFGANTQEKDPPFQEASICRCFRRHPIWRYSPCCCAKEA